MNEETHSTSNTPRWGRCMRGRWVMVAAAVVLLTTGCGDDDRRAPRDAGAGVDAATDTGSPATDAGADASPFDATPTPDAGPPKGMPVVAWLESVSDVNQVYLRRWNGTAWEELGGSASGGGISDGVNSASYVDVAVGSAGDPVVVWIDNEPSASAAVYVRRWTGSTWEELDGSATGGGISNPVRVDTDRPQSPTIAVGAGDNIVVAWNHPVFTTEGACCVEQMFYLRRWNGTVWEELDGSATGPGIAGVTYGLHPDVGIGPDGHPVVAWNQSGGGACVILLLRWTGSSWEQLAGSAGGNGVLPRASGGPPSLALDSLGNPTVARQLSDASYASARRWDGMAWQDIGSPSSDGSCGGRAPTLIVDSSDAPILARRDRDATLDLRRWNGMGWTVLRSPPAMAPSGGLGLAAEPGERFVFTWSARLSDGDFEVYVVRWNGSEYEELAGSGTGGGLSDTMVGDSMAPHIAAVR